MEEPRQYSEKRAFKRISSNMHVKFYFENSVYFGTVSNISANGMFINTNKIVFPLHSRFEVFIPADHDKVLRIPVMVSRLEKTDGYYNGMGVELLNVPEKYLDLMSRVSDEFLKRR